jgi:hypothetical protein
MSVMKTRPGASFLCLALAGLFLSGCASSHAPTRWLPSPDRLPFEAYGGWLFLELQVLDTVILSPKVGMVIDSAGRAYFHLFPDIQGFTSAVIRRSRDKEYYVHILSLSAGGKMQDTTVHYRESALLDMGEKIEHFEGITDGTYRPGDQEVKFQILPGTHTGVGDRTGGIVESLEGEFIAVDRDAVYIQHAGVQSVRRENIRHAILETQSNDVGMYTAWTLIGAISTLSHGYGLIISAPAWIIVGSLSTASLSYLGRYEQTHPDPAWWSEVSMFARFPQGVPENIDLEKVLPKIY